MSASCSTIVYDQILPILKAVRGEMRENYDNGSKTVDEVVAFRLDRERNIVLRCDDADGIDVQGRCIVSWDNNNADLRSLTRDVGYQLEHAED